MAALDAATGNQVWMVKPGGPLRGAPTIANDTVYVMSQDSQLFALNAANGATRWTGAGSFELAGVFGIAAPAFAQSTVVAGFSSGELTAYRYENGQVVWQDALARTGISTTVGTLSDIDADPVIDNGRVFAIGQGGRMVAVELITGQRAWEINIAGISTPWVAGDWVFVVTDEAQLLAVAALVGPDPLDLAAARATATEDDAQGPDLLARAGARRQPADPGQLERHDRSSPRRSTARSSDQDHAHGSRSRFRRSSSTTRCSSSTMKAG